MNIDPERTTCNVVIQIRDMNVVVKDVGKGSIVIGTLVVASVKKSAIHPLSTYS